MQFDMSKILEILYTWFVMCLSDIHVAAGVCPIIDECDSKIKGLKNVVKDSLNDYLWKKTKRSPMILPILMEI